MKQNKTEIGSFFFPSLKFHARKLKYLCTLAKVEVIFCQNGLPSEEQPGLYSSF